MTDLRHYVDLIKKNDDLITINKKVNTKFEIAGITSKLDNSKAVLFTKIDGSNFRLISNLIGTKTRYAQAIGSTENNIHNKIIDAVDQEQMPRIISTEGKFTENRSTDLSILPIVTHFEKEPGPFITSSIIHVKNSHSKTQNLSFHRLQYIDENHLSVRMVEGRHLHRAFLDAKIHGDDLKVAIVIGVHPAISIASAYQLDYAKNEISIANSILNNNISLTRCSYSELYVPSNTEIVIEGIILQDTIYKEWMVEMLRTYDFVRSQPVFELKHIYFRNNPIFHDILPGYYEHRLIMGLPIEAKLNKLLKRFFPQVKQVCMTSGGCNWLHAVVQISKKTQSDPKNIIHKTLELHKSLKMVTIVDDDIDPSSPISVEYAIATRFQAQNDLILLNNIRGSSLDPSSDQKNLLTSKLGLDATKSFSKRQAGFEIAKIPKFSNISLQDYL